MKTGTEFLSESYGLKFFRLKTACFFSLCYKLRLKTTRPLFAVKTMDTFEHFRAAKGIGGMNIKKYDND
jgi:hypothetical protein